MSNKDIFYLDKVFPEADKIFSEKFKTVNDLIKDAIVVLDTNVLLVPFDTNEKNVDDIKDIYVKYKTEKRLFISARTAREFANNRAHKIGDIFYQMRQIKEKLNSSNFILKQYPILENNPDYQELTTNFKSIIDLMNASRKNLNNIESHIQTWNWDDRVSNMYKEIFTKDTIVEVQKTKEELEKDLAFRIDYKVAPGYKDSGKPDDGIGDLIIWQTILEIARDQKKDIIFVSNDQKNDWFYKQDKVGLYPKYELFDEFRRTTNGKSIAIINFVKFLELSNAKVETIEEVKTTVTFGSFEEDDSIPAYEMSDLKVGMDVEHRKFGQGVVVQIDKVHVLINFARYGEKNFLLKYVQLKILNTINNYVAVYGFFEESEKDEEENRKT